ncbi:MAG TPA: dihydrodipicolinate synthase family protein [Tepidisphaeraceae bacterium]|nr:dihydrodipicolinate synthase family protein [Tepidisphaeraceae bacterium]
MPLHLRGLIAAPFTPLTADGELNLPAVAAQHASLRAHDVSGAFVCGTAGEFSSLTPDERTALAARWRDVASADFPLIVNVTDNAQATAIRLAAQAKQIGATAIACMAPCYLKPQSAADVAAFVGPVAAAAAPLPFFYYHFPAMTGVPIPLYDALDAIDAPTLAGAKFSGTDLSDLARCFDAFAERLDVLLGNEALLLHALALGGRAFVGATFNFAAPMYRRLIDAFDSGDSVAARAEQSHAADLLRICESFGGLRAWKAITAATGIDPGPVRPPLRPMGADERARLFEALGHRGFARPV